MASCCVDWDNSTYKVGHFKKEKQLRGGSTLPVSFTTPSELIIEGKSNLDIAENGGKDPIVALENQVGEDVEDGIVDETILNQQQQPGEGTSSPNNTIVQDIQII